MRWGEQITLIALSDPSPSTNEHGFPVARIENATTVFADKKSVGFSEFYKAQQAGYTTELKFDVHSFEYSKGFKIDAETLDKLIEAAVFNLPDYFTISGIPADTDSNKE